MMQALVAAVFGAAVLSDATGQQKTPALGVSQEQSGESGWTSRKMVGVILSTLIPGAGQSYLGHVEKGAAFTITTFGSGLMAGISENNVVGRNERLDELKSQYAHATTYVTADFIWNKMVETKSILDSDVRRRDTFLVITAALWIANLVDIVLFTEDKGEKPFGAAGRAHGPMLALTPHPINGVNAVILLHF
jgi:hypothetical protein